MSANLEENMRATTKAFVVDAWSGTWTLEKALAHRAPECTQTMLPTSQGAKPLGNDEWAAYFKKMEGKVWDAKMEMSEYTVDLAQRRTVCYSKIAATSVAGPFSNEYVWFLTFNESGKKITSIVEFLDSKQSDDVRAALRASAQQQA